MLRDAIVILFMKIQRKWRCNFALCSLIINYYAKNNFYPFCGESCYCNAILRCPFVFKRV